MTPQDITISIANIFLSYALVPQIYKNYKEKRGNVDIQTSAITFTALYVLSYTFLTLNLFISSMATGTAATLWLILFIQRIVYRK